MISDQPQNRLLTSEELLDQLQKTLKEDKTPSFRGKVMNLLELPVEEEGTENQQKTISRAFTSNPSEIEIRKLPIYMQLSYSFWEKLPLVLQEKISYYEENWVWFVNIDGVKISMKNEEFAEDELEGEGIFTYTPPWLPKQFFLTQAAALSYATRKEKNLPTKEMWEKMNKTLGGLLGPILQLKDFKSYQHLNSWDHKSVWLFHDLWCTEAGYCFFYDTNHGSVWLIDDESDGLNVRFLGN